MTSEERAQVLVTARILEAAGKLDFLSTGLTLIAAGAVLFHSLQLWSAVAAIAFGLVAKLYAVRIALDARLLSDIAAGSLATTELDHALVALALAPREKTGRDWNARCRGARRLIVWFAAATTAQCVAMMFM